MFFLQRRLLIQSTALWGLVLALVGCDAGPAGPGQSGAGSTVAGDSPVGARQDQRATGDGDIQSVLEAASASDDPSAGSPSGGATRAFPDSVLCPVSPAGSPTVGPSQQFLDRCAGCHGQNGAGQPGFPSLRMVASYEDFENAVRTGPGVMPAFAEGTLDAATLRMDYVWLSAAAGEAAPTGDSECGAGFDPAAAMDEAACRVHVRRQ